MSDTSTAHKPQLHVYYYALIPDQTGVRFLMLEAEGGWTLPLFASEAKLAGDVSRLALFKLALNEKLGVEATVLRPLYEKSDREVKHQHDAVFLMENHSLAWSPGDGTRWIGRDTLPDLLLAVPELRPVLEAWLREAALSIVPARRVPWYEVGWYEAAVAWVEGQLSRLDIEPTGLIEQVRHWCISSIMRVPTKSGYVYFKAVPPIFAREPGLTKALEARCPGNICGPLAIAELDGQSWMLTPDFGSKLADKITLEATEVAVRALARMQVESVALGVDRLFADGCADRRLQTVPAEFDALLSDESALKDMNPDEISRLRGVASKLRATCAQLVSYAVPETLAHGDFHANNIAFRDGNPIIFDWTDGCVAHPFVDLPVLLEFDTPEDAPDARDRLRDAYLEAWMVFESMDRLREAFALGEVVAAVHQAISYRYIVAGIEDAQKWEMEEGTTEFLRVVLRHAG